MSADEKKAIRDKITAAKARIESLRQKISESLESQAIGSTSPMTEDTVNRLATTRLKTRRKLAGHFGKVVSFSWARDSERAMTASQDGNVIVWNVVGGKKTCLIPLKSSWVMFAEMSHEGYELFATGGLDNVATIWQAPTHDSPHRLKEEFYGHEGYVCGARFLTDTKIVTTSGDHTAGLWDLNKSKRSGSDKDWDDRISIFRGHEKDVTSIDLKPNSNYDFVTSSTDGTCCIWNVNHSQPNAILRLTSPASGGKSPAGLLDINKVKFMSNGHCIGCATEAYGSYLYDIRARGILNTFDSTIPGNNNEAAKYSLAFSHSGRLMFVAGEDYTIEVWDTLIPDSKKPLQSISNVHSNRVTDVAVPPSGFCLGASSWDAMASVIAP